MSTALYKALIEAGVSEDTATVAAENSGQTERLARIETDLAAVKAKLDLACTVGIGFLLAILVGVLVPLIG